MLPLVIQDAAERFGDQIAYVSADGWTISFRELHEASGEAAVGLQRRGIGEGSVVALLLPSTIDYLVAYAALAKVGALTAGINPRYQPREQRSVLGVTKPNLLLTTAEVAEALSDEQSAAEADPVEEVLLIELASAADQLLIDLRIPGESPAPLPPDRDRNVALCFTSGSTGEPKGALFTNRQLEAIRELDTGGAWGSGGHAIAPTEFAHVGFMTKWPWLLAGGSTTHLQHRWRAGRVLELLHEHKIPAVAGVVPQIALLLAHPDFDTYDFSAVKAIVAGAAASPPALVAEARERFGATYLIRYSSTESGGIGLGTAPDADDFETLHSIGRPRTGVDAEVRDDDGRPLPHGEIGELWLRSPAMMAGYWNNPEATAETLVDGWLRTGDLAQTSETGLFHLAGRVKEMFIRGGYNVYPMEVESVLSTHPGVAEVVVVPRPDPVMGEIGVAAVVPLDRENPPDLEGLRAHGKSSLAAYKLPEAIEIVSGYPRNANQKVDRRALQADLLQG